MQIAPTFTQLTHLGLLKISGPDAAKFLQGQLTCQVNDITESCSTLGAHCNPQGKVISLFRIFFYQNSYFLQLPREMVDVAKQALAKYAVFFKVLLTDVSDQFFQYGLISDKQMTESDQIMIQENGSPSRWIMMSQTESFFQFEKISLEQWRAIDLNNKQPNIYPETSEKFFTHELELTRLNAINFNKGCYTGQEIIARMHYRGKIKTQLISAKIQAVNISLQRGQDLINDHQEYATLVDFCMLDKNEYQLLIIVPINFSNKNFYFTHAPTIPIEWIN